MKFEDKVVVITGGAKGIGKCIANEFRKEGAIVCIIDKVPGDYFVGDISNRETLEQFAQFVIGQYGHVDFLINNALPLMKGINECGYDEFQYALAVGITAPFYLTRLFQPYFSKGAAIVNISSSRDRMSQPQTESYTAAKGGIAALSHALAVSLAGKVRVNSISPGWIDTGWKEYWIGFKGSQMDSWVSNGFFSPQAPLWNIGLRSDVVDLYKEAIDAAGAQQSGVQQRLSGIVAHLMGLAWFYRRNQAFSEVEDKMNRAKILISSQLPDITPEGLAESLCMGYSNFRRIFKEYTGLSPARYILQMRLNKIKEKLTNTSLPVKQIAAESGYANEDYFYTVFRRMTGMTPTEYRLHAHGPAQKNSRKS